MESTRALGCFSASVNGLLGYPSLQTIDLDNSDEAILVASFELWETLGPQQIVQLVSQEILNSNLKDAMNSLSDAFTYESGILKRDTKIFHEFYNAIVIKL